MSLRHPIISVAFFVSLWVGDGGRALQHVTSAAIGTTDLIHLKLFLVR